MCTMCTWKHRYLVAMEAFPVRKELWQQAHASPGLFMFVKELATNLLALQFGQTEITYFAGMSRHT